MAAAARRRTAIASKRSMADDEARTAIAVAKRGTGVLRARVDIPLIKMPTPVKRIVAAVERRQAAVARRPCCRAVTDEAARIATAVATSGATARIDILGRRDVSGRPNKTCHLQHPFSPLSQIRARHRQPLSLEHPCLQHNGDCYHRAHQVRLGGPRSLSAKGGRELYEPIDPGSPSYTLTKETVLINARRVRVTSVALKPVPRPAPPVPTAAASRSRRDGSAAPGPAVALRRLPRPFASSFKPRGVSCLMGQQPMGCLKSEQRCQPWMIAGRWRTSSSGRPITARIGELAGQVEGLWGGAEHMGAYREPAGSGLGDAASSAGEGEHAPSTPPQSLCPTWALPLVFY